jgi:hypothetical protein
MKSAYRVLAYLVAFGVLVQAASIAFAIFGLTKWIEEGGTLDNAAMESGSIEFTGVLGFPIHFITGQLVIPLLGLIMLVVSFFTKIPGASKWAGFVLLAIVVQVLLGMLGHGIPGLGALHGLNALVLFGLAVMAGMRVARPGGVDRPRRASSTTEPELV